MGSDVRDASMAREKTAHLSRNSIVAMADVRSIGLQALSFKMAVIIALSSSTVQWE